MDHPMSDGRQGRMFGQGGRLSVHQVVQKRRTASACPFQDFLGVLQAARARVPVMGHRPAQSASPWATTLRSAASMSVHFRLLEPAFSKRIFM